MRWRLDHFWSLSKSNGRSPAFKVNWPIKASFSDDRVVLLRKIVLAWTWTLLKGRYNASIQTKSNIYETHVNQSTANIRAMSSVGSPTAARTNSIVTSPACGTEAAPIAARVAVMLKHQTNSIRKHNNCSCDEYMQSWMVSESLYFYDHVDCICSPRGWSTL